jgi:transcriptional regulator with XRE-family HTH domain
MNSILRKVEVLAMQYGKVIRRLRKEKGVTQAQLGLMIGKKQNQISEWESERIKPSPEDIVDLCKAFNVNISKFYGIESEYEIVVDVAKGKGLSPEEAIKAIELYLLYKSKQ